MVSPIIEIQYMNKDKIQGTQTNKSINKEDLPEIAGREICGSPGRSYFSW